MIGELPLKLVRAHYTKLLKGKKLVSTACSNICVLNSSANVHTLEKGILKGILEAMTAQRTIH